MSKWIDTTGIYPQMHATLPRQSLDRYRQMMFNKGFYPLSGRVRDLNHDRFPCREELGGRAAEDQEIDLQYRKKLLEKLGLAYLDAEKLQLPHEAPGVVKNPDRPGPSRNDPQLLGNVSKKLMRQLGWQRMLDVAEVKANWDKYVGQQVAEKTRVEGLQEGRLLVRASSAVWATQLRLLLPTLEKQLAARLGFSLQVIILGPQSGTWRRRSFPVSQRSSRRR